MRPIDVAKVDDGLAKTRAFLKRRQRQIWRRAAADRTSLRELVQSFDKRPTPSIDDARRVLKDLSATINRESRPGATPPARR